MKASPETLLIDEAEQALLALDPVKRRLLSALRQPASAAMLARQLDMPRQQIGYHLRALEEAGLIHLAEERVRRGFVERVLVAAADSFVLDPAMLVPPSVASQDSYSAAHLVQAAGAVVREVTRMRGAAESAGQRLLTFTIEADLGFSEPKDFDAFADALARSVADLARQYPAAPGRKSYHVVIGAHPAVAGTSDKPVN